MNNTVFSKSFNFNTIRFDTYHYTDNRGGTVCHYLARLDRGRARIVWDGGTLELNEGDHFYIPMGMSYRSYWYGEPEIEFVSLGFVYFPNESGSTYPLQKVFPDGEGRELFDKIKTEQDHSCSNIGVFYTLLGRLLGLMEADTDAHHGTLARAIDFINKNPDASVPEIARHCNISESGLYYVFKKYAKTTPNGYRLSLKVKKAKALLTTTDLSIEEISDRCGFCSSGYFRRVFKSIEGTLPSRVRGGKGL